MIKIVRQWHSELTPWLDDARILAQHAEAHYIDSALERGSGIWWRHPETQRFRDYRPALRALHRQSVEEIRLRGYNHWTPMEGFEYSSAWHVSFMQYDCFEEPYAWLNQDKADLYRKWTKEGRWRYCLLESGQFGWFFDAGRMRKRDSAGNHTGFHPPRRPLVLQPDMLEYREIAERYYHREWSKADKLRLRVLMDELVDSNIVSP